MVCTMPLTSLETSLSLVWLLNLGSGTLAEITAVSPSRTSSPDKVTLADFSRLFFSA